MCSLTFNLKVTCLLEQQFEIGKIIGNQKSWVSHEVQYVSEHATITINEIVLFQWVQHNWYGAVEEFCQLWVRILGERFQWAGVDRATNIDMYGRRIPRGRCYTWYACDGLVIGMQIGTGAGSRSAARSAGCSTTHAGRQTDWGHRRTGWRCGRGWGGIRDRRWDGGWGAERWRRKYNLIWRIVSINDYLILMSPLAKIRPVDDKSRGSSDFVSLSRSRSISHFFLQK